MRTYWLDGIMGLVVGDALGFPVQFMEREVIRNRPQGAVVGMEPLKEYRIEKGTWSDDSSMSLVALDSIRRLGRIDLDDIMTGFVQWVDEGEFTPFGQAIDMGNTCMRAIGRYKAGDDVMSCGCTSERSNGNGSIMRILPVCLYACEQNLSEEEAIKIVHEVSGLTHNHLRSKIACGLYGFCVKEILDGEGSLIDRLQNGLDKGFFFYEKDETNLSQLAYYDRLRDLKKLAATPEDQIKSSGYVVDTIEAAFWSLIRTGDYRDCLLTAVNLGDDADSVGAVAGGLAGLYYGYGGIPEEWLADIRRREWVESFCMME